MASGNTAALHARCHLVDPKCNARTSPEQLYVVGLAVSGRQIDKADDDGVTAREAKRIDEARLVLHEHEAALATDLGNAIEDDAVAFALLVAKNKDFSAAEVARCSSVAMPKT